MLSSNNFLQKHSKIALGYFFIIAFLGVLLRFFSVYDLSFTYRFVVHTHSHIALLGWVYTAITTLIFKMYLSELNIKSKYQKIFWATQVTIIGMLVTFPFTGYALFSIIFSTLFLIISYVYAYLIIKNTSKEQKRTQSYKCIRIALWYMIISSIGPWALGVIMKTAGSGSDLYKNAIYFYLHFQYNGWFILALFGIGFYILEKQNIRISKSVFNIFFWLMNLGVILTFGISLLWMKPHLGVYLVSGLGAVFQLISFVYLIYKLRDFKEKIKKSYSSFFLKTLKVVVLLFFLKLVFQLLGTIPEIANRTASNIDLVIGYLHWIFLGVVSICLLLFLYSFKLITLSKRSIVFYVVGFLLTEVLIFYKELISWFNLLLIDFYFEALVIVSFIFFIAITYIFMSQFKRK
ncbi:hypothetical protein [uncultured Tenacibaculum sp.]|uniref:hypothetical protein n=1 Tax=uncultured Tenacibaculum sp. TaxID=174713 RepID=UPI0026078D0D|nr:hypothetical protein [uncultured Tenacibaculum sp.]